jgi:hypothetical protein
MQPHDRYICCESTTFSLETTTAATTHHIQLFQDTSGESACLLHECVCVFK